MNRHYTPYLYLHSKHAHKYTILVGFLTMSWRKRNETLRRIHVK